MSSTKNTSMGTNGYYNICVKGHLDDRWLRWFEGLTVSLLDSGETVIQAPNVDQAALFGILHRIRDLGLELISVQKYDPDTEI